MLRTTDIGRTVDVSALIDASRVGAFQVRVIVLCGLIALLDGFDIQAIAFVAPVLSRELGLGAVQMGSILSASPIGILVGAMFLAPLGDRLGRRPALLWGFILVGVSSLATALAQDAAQVFVCRFLTGVGLGATMPNVVALTSEFVPARLRTFLVSVMFCGIPLGGFVGGLLATVIVENWGWRPIFVIGGVLPLVICVLLWWTLPESLRFRIARGASREEIATTLSRVVRGYAPARDEAYTLAERPPGNAAPWRALLEGSSARTTLILWFVFFCNFAVLYLLLSWLPTLLLNAGWTLKGAFAGTSVFMLGGAVGGLLLAWWVDLWGARRTLVPAFVVTAIAVAALGAAGWNLALVWALAFLAGVGTVGTQSCLNVVAANSYETHVRSTGVGWALGVGRIGAILSPMAGGMALAAGWSSMTMFLLAAVPSVLCAAALMALGAALQDPRARKAHSASLR